MQLHDLPLSSIHRYFVCLEQGLSTQLRLALNSLCRPILGSNLRQYSCFHLLSARTAGVDSMPSLGGIVIFTFQRPNRAKELQYLFPLQYSTV